MRITKASGFPFLRSVPRLKCKFFAYGKNYMEVSSKVNHTKVDQIAGTLAFKNRYF